MPCLGLRSFEIPRKMAPMAYEKRSTKHSTRPGEATRAPRSERVGSVRGNLADASNYSRSRYGSKRHARSSGHADGASVAADAASYSDRSRYTHGRGASDTASTVDSFSSASGPRTTRYHYAAKRKSKRTKVAAGVLIALLVVMIGGGGAALAYFNKINSNLHAGVDQGLLAALTDPLSDTDPFYVLLMGTDWSADREEDAEFEGDAFRTDSIMLVRVDPKEKKVTMVSILRDTYVDMGEYGKNKINAAHALGGPELAVQTVSELAGVDISHYAELNFDGFKSIVDALGGIEVDVPMTIDDDEAGGYVEAGLQTLNGDQALILCRSRHAYDDYGKGDEYRAANQRLVLSAIAKKLLDSDAATMASTVSALSQYVTTDYSVNELVNLAQTMKGMDTSSDIYTGTEPTESVYVDDGWYELVDVEEWSAMMERVDQGLPPNEEDVVDSATGTVFASGGGSTSLSGTVEVLNGNGVSGVSTSAARVLRTAGLETQTGNAETFDYPATLVVYGDNGQKSTAEAIASQLGVGEVQANDGSYSLTTDYLVILGADYS